MQQILVYGDSLTWGIIPNTRQRLAFHKRWPGALERLLHERQQPVRVIEDCLNGRRTVWEDPFKPGRNGLLGLEQRIEVNSPLSLVLLLLGTNDFQSVHDNTAFEAARGIACLVGAIRKAPIEPGMSAPEILVIVPPLITESDGSLGPKFRGAAQKCVGLVEAYRDVADECGCPLFDANLVTSSSPLDGVHLDEPQHARLAAGLLPVVLELLKRR